MGWITNSTERWWIFPGLLPDHLGAELTTNNKHYHRYIHNIQHCSHQGWNHSSFVEITIRKQQEISKFRLQNIIVLILILQVITSPSLCSGPGHHCPCPSVPAHQLTSTINITSYHRLLSTLYLKALIKCFTICQWHRHKKQQFKAQAVDIQHVFCIHNSKKRRKLELGYSENVLMVWTDLLNNFLQRMFCKKW